jgi:adenylate cyclase
MGCTHVGWCRGGGDPEQPMNNKSWWRCFQSRLSRRVVRSVLFSILGIEILVFIPSYLLKEQTLLQELGDSTRQSLAVAMTSRPAQTQPYTIDQVSQILTQYRLKNSVIQSGVVFDPTGKDLRDFGEPQYLNQLKTSLKTSRKNRQRRFRDQSLIEVVWSPEVLKTDYGVALILNTQSIQRELGQYTLRTLAMVLLITAFVGLVMFLVLQRILITPILQFREDLQAAGEAASEENSPLFYTFYQTRRDELGDVAIAFCQMYHQVRQEIRDRKRAETALIAEQEKSERLLLNVLPNGIAHRLKEDPGALAARFDEVTILFADIVGFTGLATQLNPLEMLTQLNGIFSAFDQLAEQYSVEKIKTIGDAYMVVGGMPTLRPDHADAVLEMAIKMLEVTRQFSQPNGNPYQLRIGINTGPVIAGVIGRKKFSYDLWGDAVNVASRMESHGLPDQIQVTPMTYDRLKHLYRFEKRAEQYIRSVGTMDTYLYVDRLVVNTTGRPAAETAPPARAFASEPSENAIIESADA